MFKCDQLYMAKFDEMFIGMSMGQFILMLYSWYKKLMVENEVMR